MRERVETQAYEIVAYVKKELELCEEWASEEAETQVSRAGGYRRLQRALRLLGVRVPQPAVGERER